MCEFCESIKDGNKKIIWQVRSTFADDNICEYVNNTNCDLCDGCNMYFKLSGYDYKGDTMISVDYYQRLISQDKQEVIISPFSESIQFNYCPFCGEQISKNIVQFEEIYVHKISVEED